ncbi:MAG: tetratricopeptide repeat protein [Lachnospiraceae bacterium]|nr:tetratricopeptide repeat protein [Lachnospiraceae bacterium]
MKCMNCGAELTESAYCPNCGCDVSVQKQAIVLSGIYYNQGLEKAQVRDLSGAIDQLKRSLKFNKMNIPARNLLGLVYFETGEVVAALSEWVISKNIQPEDNIATEYIENLHKDANRLDLINQTIKKYNIALKNCLDGNEDVAMIQLKKILAQNPKLVKAYHLLALLYIDKKQYEKARKLLKKAIRIDKTNTTTLRFLKEVDEQTGTATVLEPKFSLWGGRRSDTGQEGAENVQTGSMQPAYRAPRARFSALNIIIGALIGAAAVWFLFIPARTSSINRTANEKVTRYSSDMASYSAQIQNLNKRVEEAEKTSSTASAQVTTANTRATSYEGLISAMNSYQQGSTDQAASSLSEVDPDQLSSDTRAIFDSLSSQLGSQLLPIYKQAGLSAFQSRDYKTAATKLELAHKIDDQDYDIMNYLAHSYRLMGDSANADKIFELIISTFPGTSKAEDAAKYLSSNATTTTDSAEEASLTLSTADSLAESTASS